MIDSDSLKSDVLDGLFDFDVDADGRARVEKLLDRMIAAAKEEALNDHKCDHDDCVNAYEVDAEREQVRALVDLLEDLGVDEHELKCLTGAAEGNGSGHCRGDVLRHVRALPSFRQRLFATASRLYDEMGEAAVARLLGV